MKIIYDFASRSRPEKFFKCLDNININSRHDDYLIIPVLDEDDPSMFNDPVKRKMECYSNLYPVWGHSENKVHAINRGMTHAPEQWDLLIVMSDDMLFVEEGYDTRMLKDMESAFPDFDGVLHYNDGNQGRSCMTMSIMGRTYYDRFGYVYFPGYQSLWCDMEATQAARILGKYKYMGDRTILFRHLHPSFGHTNYDDQYTRTENRELWVQDEQTYRSREERRFDL